MATWTKAQLAARALEALGVVGESQSPTAEQQSRTEEVVDSIYQRLRTKQLVPFAIATIPEWAQQPMVKIVAAEISPRYGYSGGRLAEQRQLAHIGMNDLADGAAGETVNVPITAEYY